MLRSEHLRSVGIHHSVASECLGGTTCAVDVDTEVSHRGCQVQGQGSDVTLADLLRSCVDGQTNVSMSLSSEPLVVTNLQVATAACNQLTAGVELGVDEVADGVAIASATAILDDEATGSTLDLRSSHQLSLCHAVH